MESTARAIDQSTTPAASEASRILSASWIIVLLLIAGGSGRLLPDSTLIGLFVATGGQLVLGSGYTRYAEARADPSLRPPVPDRLTQLATRLGRDGVRTAAWTARYHEDF